MTTREQALEWWNSLPDNDLTGFKKSKASIVFNHLGNVPYEKIKSLTGREIELIWEDETQTLTKDIIDSKLDDMMSDLVDGWKNHVKEVVNTPPLPISKYNEKQFTSFNEELFKRYINKFSNQDKILMLSVLSCEISTINPILNDLLNRISSYKGTR